MPTWDSHCHLQLSPLFEDAKNVLRRGREVGVDGCLVPSYGLAEWPRQLQLAQEPQIRIALGLHPWSLLDRVLPCREELEGSFFHHADKLGNKLVAVGEFGLDRARPEYKALLDEQIEFFRLHLSWADRLQLPTIIHSVKALGLTLDLLQESPPSRAGVLHSYSGSPEMIERFLSLGFYLSFSGLLKTSKKARESLRNTPADRILFETDAPWGGGLSSSSEASEPAHLNLVVQMASQILDKSIEWCWSVHNENTERLFRIQETS